MSFDLEFEEVQIAINGQWHGLWNGSADVSSDGTINTITLDGPYAADAKTVLTPESHPQFAQDLFHAIAAGIRRTYAETIAEQIASHRRSIPLDYYDWKRKNAAEMSS